MKTRKPFSTVWFGSTNFLKVQLDDILKRNKILFYAFVKHYAEEDERKDHAHVYIVPDGDIDTTQLTDILTEYDPNNELPIKPADYRSSKFGDWFLYSSHNTEYLASKGQSRKYHYSQDDFITSNTDYFIELIHQIDLSKINRIAELIKRAENGETFTSLVKAGKVPINLVSQYYRVFDMIQRDIDRQLNRKRQEEISAKYSLTEDEEEDDNAKTMIKLQEIFGNGWKRTDEKQK